ncbi:MAG TPA: DNA primase [Anaerolineales bacterium]|nr:DNA primase [Anaerolineales bacterium]
MNNIDEIKARIDIVDLVSETVKLRRSGKGYTGFCPFHDNKRTPAFAVFPESGTWRCFGQCNEGGDIFNFVMKKEGWDFSEALRYLADRAGVELRTPTPLEQEQAEENDHLRQLLEDAVIFYRHNLLNTPAGKEAYAYLIKRGLDEATIEAWGLGYGPQSWDAATHYFKERGYSEQDLLDAGLVSERDSGGVYDRFRHRVTFPIRDERGRMAGFGARILNSDDIPKFLNSPQTALFDKGRLLYGLDKAGKAIRAADQVVIVEGYLDVIALHQHGFANAVSPMGTALTEDQLRLLKRRTRRIILALDPDAAGDKATLRGLQVARQTMDREGEVSFDARGLLRQEARLQADIRVATLPDDLDPDDVVNRSPDEWVKLIENAKPIVIHVMETLAAGRNLDDTKTKSEIATQVLPLIEDVPNAIEREDYRQRLARLLRVDERALTGAARPVQSRYRPARGTRKTTQATPESRGGGSLPVGLSPVGTARALEAYCLGILLRRPDLLYQVDRALQKAGLSRLSAFDFQDASYQSIIKVILNSLSQDFAEPLHVILGSVPLSLMELVDELLARTEKLDPNDNRVLEELLRVILDMRRRGVNQNIEHLRFLMQDAQEKGDMIVADFQHTMMQHTLALGRLDHAMRQCNDHSIFVG